jgi:hypothetical protein
MTYYRYLLAVGGLFLLSAGAQAQPADPDSLARRLESLESLVAKLAAERGAATWDDYGCVPDDPSVDNGPILSRLLADQQNRKIRFVPVGALADYYIATPIIWPNRHGGALVGSGGYTYANRRDGVTRILWNGPPGEPMIIYRGQGGRIQQLVLNGSRYGQSAAVAGCGILVEAHGNVGKNAVPSGGLVTDQLAIDRCAAGIKCIDQPHGNHADNLKHFALLIYNCDVAYWTQAGQSVMHALFSADIRGCRTAFKLDEGGALSVFGCYFAPNHPEPTLLYVGRSTSNNGNFEIRGLQVDGSTRNLRVVNHGKYAHRVRVSGNIARGATLAEPVVLARDGPSPFADVRIDSTHLRWPKAHD